MKRNNRKGFTLVELLAVIVILAIILVIAVPKVMTVIEDSKKATLESTAKMIASAAEKQKVQNTVLGNDKEITCDSVAKINKLDYASCDITFEDNTAKVTIVGGGKFEGLNICGGTKISATATVEECATNNEVQVLNCNYDGELVQGAEFVHNQYTYRYMQDFSLETDFMNNLIGWQNIDVEGWGVILTDKTSTDPINTPVCSYINEKPVVSMMSMFSNSAATSLDLSSFDTSNVTNMSNMFNGSAATTLDLSKFDTSNVRNMEGMFCWTAATTLDLSNFDTSKVTNMRSMFEDSKATTIDLSNFDTSKVTNMSSMFRMINATTIYVGDNWNTSNVKSTSFMFAYATNLVGGNGTAYNTGDGGNATYARVDKEGEPGYFTYKSSN